MLLIPQSSSSPLELKCTSGKVRLQERICERKMSETISFFNMKCCNGVYNRLLLAHSSGNELQYSSHHWKKVISLSALLACAGRRRGGVVCGVLAFSHPQKLFLHLYFLQLPADAFARSCFRKHKDDRVLT